MDEAIRQRDLDWKKELERRNQMRREEFQKRDKDY